MSTYVIAPRAELWIVAGPNGAGKSTIIQSRHLRHRLQHTRALNADDRTRELLAQEGLDFSAPLGKLEETFIEAANQTFAETISLLAKGEAVCVETVLSTDKYRDLVESVLAAKSHNSSCGNQATCFRYLRVCVPSTCDSAVVRRRQ